MKISTCFRGLNQIHGHPILKSAFERAGDVDLDGSLDHVD